jgi:hypothetical protein
MGKVKEMVDLKAKPTKVTDEQLRQLQSIVNDNNQVQFSIGSLEVQKHGLLHKLASTQETISKLQDDLDKEYGTFDIDLKDGTINYPDNG